MARKFWGFWLFVDSSLVTKCLMYSWMCLGYVWFSNGTKKRNKNIKENYFLIFDCLIEDTKENKIQLRLIRNFYILELFNLDIK